MASGHDGDQAAVARRLWKWCALAAGPILFVGVLWGLRGTMGLEPAAHRVLALGALMAWWWITEAVPVPATALLPLVILPALRVQPMHEVAVSYGDSTIFLFMGGFFLAATMQRWGLHKRLALHVIRLMGTNPRTLVLSFMIAAAALSMWISNTATTLMMYPIALALVLHLGEGSAAVDERQRTRLRTALMLGVAYGSSIGGIGTLIGTPPNLIFVAQLRRLFPQAPAIGFLDWMKVGMPLVVLFLPLSWLVLTRIVLPVGKERIAGGREVLAQELAKLGRPSRGEWLVAGLFVLTALAWVGRADIDLGFLRIPGWAGLLGVGGTVNDATVAMTTAVLLFALPVDVKKGQFLLDWETARGIPWGVLILFGGGIALAGAFEHSGLATWVAERLRSLGSLPPVLLTMLVCLTVTFLTEVTSNTAIASIFMPVLGAAAVAVRMNPLLLMVPGAITASCAFMLPVATPPNAVVFASGYLTIPQMAKAGVLLNFLGVILVTLVVYAVAIPAFGIKVGQVPAWVP
ncbi:MAG: DASS family sodium-coupled anion symporter [candidate division KSB1 bacterium]|nr:DASS family sodium-coupled anion symporter [candidate division KSB1 bacterium]